MRFFFSRFFCCTFARQLVEFQRRFLSVVIISAYPVFRPGVDAIVASPAANEFLWPTLYDAFFSTNGMAVKDEFTTVGDQFISRQP